MRDVISTNLLRFYGLQDSRFISQNQLSVRVSQGVWGERKKVLTPSS